jgi:anti-sigma regulatory factor (Ser/Thr protein kinase)
MIAHQQISIPISDRSSIGQARRMSSLIGERARMRELELGRIPLIVTELATNLLLHAKGGEIIIRMLPVEVAPGLEIIALDRGPGIADLRRCMTDGYSGGGTRGCGLGAVRRLSTEFDIYSTQPSGTAIISRVRSDDGKSPAATEYSVICVPAPSETECGDAWQLRLVGHNLSVIVLDGLGHGPLAAKAAAEGLAVFGEGRFEGPLAYFEAAHSSMNTTRGAAIAVAQVNTDQRKLHYAGVGNIAGRLISFRTGKSNSLISQNGIVGTTVRKLQQFDYQWEDGDLLIMHSDGLTDRWNLSDYPGLARADTAVIAAVLYRDAKRGRDDTTVSVVRLKTSPLK